MHFAKYYSLQYLKAILWFLLLGILMLTVNPMEVPVVVLTVPFLLLSFGLYHALRALVQISDPAERLSLGRQRTIACAGTVVGTGALGLQSIGQLTVRDFLVLLLLAACAYFYIVRNTLGSR